MEHNLLRDDRIGEFTAKEIAHAVIEAMRVPTDAMCEAGVESGAVENGVFHIRDHHMRHIWDEMIDAALKD